MAHMKVSLNTPTSSNQTATPIITPGAVLIREWNGRRYQVRALDKGFEMDGRSYKSLSQIARTITGAHWSGPRFFGLVKAPGPKAGGKQAKC